jgi:hypothetical protein
MVLTNTIQLLMWWAAFCLRIREFFTGGFRIHRFCTWLSKLWTPRPPERIDRGRPKGTNKAEQRKQRFTAEVNSLKQPPSVFKRVTRQQSSSTTRRLLLLGLAFFSSTAESPNDSSYLTVDTGCSRSSTGSRNAN